MQGNVLSVGRIIAAPPERIFELLADASRHALVDGSGTLQGSDQEGPQKLGLGSTFGMSMRIGVPYRMLNRVVEFEPERRIAWEARPAGPLGRFVGGRVWRYVLEPIDNGTRTQVTESWDISADRQRAALKLGSIPERTRRNMERTLARIAELVGAE